MLSLGGDTGYMSGSIWKCSSHCILIKCALFCIYFNKKYVHILYCFLQHINHKYYVPQLVGLNHCQENEPLLASEQLSLS